MFDTTLLTAAEALLARARAAGQKIVTAESCTGGLIAAVLTAIPGSSDVLERGFVTYSNEAKAELLGVDGETLEEHGAVSEAVATQMAVGALDASRAHVSVSVTGIAGPGGGTADKPVGLVFIATSGARETPDGVATSTVRHEFGELSRDEIRKRTVLAAFQQLTDRLPE